MSWHIPTDSAEWLSAPRKVRGALGNKPRSLNINKNGYTQKYLWFITFPSWICVHFLLQDNLHLSGKPFEFECCHLSQITYYYTVLWFSSFCLIQNCINVQYKNTWHTEEGKASFASLWMFLTLWFVFLFFCFFASNPVTLLTKCKKL